MSPFNSKKGSRLCSIRSIQITLGVSLQLRVYIEGGGYVSESDSWGESNLVACQAPQTGTQRPGFKDRWAARQLEQNLVQVTPLLSASVFQSAK